MKRKINGYLCKWSHTVFKRKPTKIKKKEKKKLNLINCPLKKFESSIMMAGGICCKGLSNLFVLEGPDNEFSYTQFLQY